MIKQFIEEDPKGKAWIHAVYFEQECQHEHSLRLHITQQTRYKECKCDEIMSDTWTKMDSEAPKIAAILTWGM